MDEYHKISFATFMRVVALLEMLGWKVEIEFALNFKRITTFADVQ